MNLNAGPTRSENPFRAVSSAERRISNVPFRDPFFYEETHQCHDRAEVLP